MTGFEQVIDSFGGPAGFAKATGLKGSHVRTMKARKSIPSEYWPRVVAAAQANSIEGVTFELLATINARQAGQVSEQVAS